MSENMDGEILRREFPAALESSGDGRTLDVRIVPYDIPTRVTDPPFFEPYDEMWVAGAFDKQLSAPNRVSVFVNVEHEQGIKGVVGRGTALREVPGDGLHGTFRMLSHSDADKALELVNEGDLTGVSLEFVPLKSVRENGVVKRLKARLVNVALVRPSGSSGGIQAYKEAGVLAVRETTPEPEPEHEVTIEATERLTQEAATAIQTEWVNATSTDPSEVEQALARVGYEPLVKRIVTRQPWDGTASRFTDDEYTQSCLIDRGGDDQAKERCSVPVLEPNGDVNANALAAATARLHKVQATPEQKASGARKLIRYLNQADMESSQSLRALASR